MSCHEDSHKLSRTPTGAGAVGRSAFGGGVGPILLSQLNCNGSESSLVDCPLPSFGLFSLFCNHANDAGVICRGEEEGGRGRGGRWGEGGEGGKEREVGM